MANEKRVRQKEGRLQRLEEQRAVEKRSQRFRQLRAVGLVIVAVVAIGFLISVLSSDDEELATEPSSTTTEVTPTDAPSTEPPPTTAVEYSEPEIAEEVLARKPPKPDGAPEDTPKDAVEVKTIIEGEGRAIESGDNVTVHYYGVLPDGEKFDDSWSRGAPFTTTIPGQVIDGWNEGLIGRKIGERFELTIGSDKGYGPAGSGAIPPDTPLVFAIDVVDAVPPAG